MLFALLPFPSGSGGCRAAERFEGRFFRGEGDAEYLQLLETAGRMFSPDPEFQNVGMFYWPDWNGLVEGLGWEAWWIQDSYGPTYCALPFYQEPFTTFLQNAQDLWFDHMGDGKTQQPAVTEGPFLPYAKLHWIPPDGCLCDCACLGCSVPKQGDGRYEIHDWGMEFTAAGLLMQSELLLIGRDVKAIGRYLPKLRRVAAFIETRRDPKNNLFLAGPAGNLLAPSYAGWKKPDGSFDKAYLTGLSITYIAALDRLIELEKLAGHADYVATDSRCRELARKGLPLLTTDEGYFIKSLDPDGTKHGVYGAPKHGYFETVCNHDAVCFRVADDVQAGKIYAKIASIPGLRPHDLILPNYPSLDDMYAPPQGFFEFGFLPNGGPFFTCEARMIMAYCRLGKYEDVRRSMQHLLPFARRFRMDNSLTKFGTEVYQTQRPINCMYDAWGIPAAMIRGLFEYLYRADGLTILPHVPSRITRLEQQFPIRFGKKRLVPGRNGTRTGHRCHRERSTVEDIRRSIRVLALRSHARRSSDRGFAGRRGGRAVRAPPARSVGHCSRDPDRRSAGIVRGESPRRTRAARGRRARFHARLVDAGLGDTYEAAHAGLVASYLATTVARLRMVADGRLPRLPAASQAAADRSYVETTARLCEGLEKMIQSYRKSEDPKKQQIWRLWRP